MSNFRERAAEIKAAGEAQRDDWTPHGVPKQIYDFWLENSRSLDAARLRRGSRQENFCHFWRVVAIWAPLLVLGHKLDSVLDSKWLPPVGIAIVLVALLSVATALDGLGIMLLVMASILALIGIIVGFAFGMEWLMDHYPAGMKRVGKYSGIAALVGLAGLLIFGWLALTGYVGAIILFALACAGVVFYVNLDNISAWIQGRRELKRERMKDLADEDVDYFMEHGEWPGMNKEPGRLSKFFSGVGDFLVLLAQVVRVNKWKICPIVNIKE